MVIVSSSESIKKKVYHLWSKNPALKAKQICSTLKLNYSKHGNYVNKLLSELRSYPKFGIPLKPQSLHKRIFCWENVPRQLLLDHLSCKQEELTEEKLAKIGWKASSNKNGMLHFSDKRGRVHWYRNGKVLLYLGNPPIIAKAKELFCRAFSWFDGTEISKYTDVPLREKCRHWVFDVGKPIPKIDIRQFKSSHGIYVYSDNSHPNAVEVEETVPFWIDEFREIAQNFGESVTQFGDEIAEHLKLIREWQNEAKDRREKSLINYSKNEKNDLVTVLKKLLNYKVTSKKNE